MTAALDLSVHASSSLPPSTRGATARQWLSGGMLVPAAVLVALCVAAAAPDLLATHPPDAVDTAALLQPPGPDHWFGTDQLGRDVYSRVVHGTSYSLLIGLAATAIALVLGMAVGLLAALGPRGLDRVLVRGLDILLAFPELLLALLVIAVMGPGPVNTAVAVGLAGVAGYARLIRSQVLSVRLSGYVEAAVALGESPWRIVTSHIAPNSLRPVLVLATVGVGTSILSASSLSFLGLGVAPPTPEWGALLADGRSFLGVAPWTSLFPATVVAAAVVSITLLGRRLQRVLTKGGTHR
jgi:peptide/nickel transport system permease protein